MNNYQNSDYAINKFSKDIVYRFNGEIVAVTLDDYLAENPGKTEQDFQALKTLSDAIYYEQDRTDVAQSKKCVSIHGMEDNQDLGGIPLIEEYIETLDKKNAITAYSQLMEDGVLTETQKRRFNLCVVNGLTLREMAERENVHFTSVDESIVSVMGKFKRFFNKF